MSGEAVVLRSDGGIEKELAKLAEGSCFGERSLLKNETRFASVLATSKVLAMMCTRKAFEKQLGPIQWYLPDEYDDG